MNNSILEELLNEDESSTLDFKRDQYPFSKASDDEKGELLKDILAFSNAWRRTDAYILIGVEEVKGGRSIVRGVAAGHLMDNHLQQFFLGKTQRPLIFSYTAYAFENQQIGILKIPVQDRPIYLKQDYGKLKKNTVYIRRNSSTGEANPDEIARMGAASSEQTSSMPTLELQFGIPKGKKELGGSLNLVSTITEYDKSEIKPLPSSTSSIFNPHTMGKNRNYPVEKAQYIAETSILNPVGFVIKNTGSTLAGNVRLEINASRDNYTVADEYSYPAPPKREHSYIDTPNFKLMNAQLRIKKHKEGWNLSVQFGSIQPGATAFCENVFFIGASMPCTVNFDAIVYADNLPGPITFPLSISIETETKPLNLDRLK